jgi:predicted hydrocarbon binding protein
MKDKRSLTEDSSGEQYYYPGRMGRVILQAMEEILGQAGMNAVLKRTGLPAQNDLQSAPDQDLKFSFSNISALQTGLEVEYGGRVGRGLALRIGRACLKYSLREFSPELGLTDLAFRLLPLQAKLKAGSETFAALFNKYTDQRVRLETDEKTILWRIERCPLCWERHAEGACCHLAVGLLQEAMYWLSGGKYFEVVEKQCIACGAEACIIVIKRTAMS